MKNYLSRKEACTLIKGIGTKTQITLKERVGLESIRVCLIGDGMGLNLWGKSIEETRPLFKPGYPVDANSSESVRKNYENYLEALEDAIEIAKEV